MSPSNLTQMIEDYRRSIDAIVQGDPEPQKGLWSRGDDVILANPLGPPAVGWDSVKAHLEYSASTVRAGEPISYESIAEYSTGDLGYNFHLERTRARFGESDEMMPVALRVTTIFRREGREWRIVHRHADPITTARPVESIVRGLSDPG